MKNNGRRPRFGFFARRFGAAAAVLLGILLLTETGLRIAGYRPVKPAALVPRAESSYLRLSRNPVLRYELGPGFQRSIRKIRVAVNSRGMRGPEVVPAKGDRIRIILLEDSVHAGTREPQTFSRKLELQLRAVDPRFEVLDMGVDGYDTLQEITALGLYGLSLSPDVVVLCYDLNDIGITPVDLRGAAPPPGEEKKSAPRLLTFQWISRTLRPRGEGRPSEGPAGGADPYGDLFPPAPTDPFLEGQFKLIAESQAVFAAASGNGAAQAVVEKPGRLWLNQYLNLKNIGKIRYAFNKLEDMALEYGFKVLIVILPFFYEVNGRYLDEPAHRIIREEASPHGFPVADLLHCFQTAGFERVSRDGVNLSDFGHVVLAKALFRVLGRFYYPELERAAESPSKAAKTKESTRR